jgi:hypothetical protein
VFFGDENAFTYKSSSLVEDWKTGKLTIASAQSGELCAAFLGAWMHVSSIETKVTFTGYGNQGIND